jgi:hypothetical protein
LHPETFDAMTIVRLHFALAAAFLSLTTVAWSQEDPKDVLKKPAEEAGIKKPIEEAEIKKPIVLVKEAESESVDAAKQPTTQKSEPAKPKKKVEPNIDLALLGEFVGQVKEDDSASQENKAKGKDRMRVSSTIALQLRPVGNDQFDGLAYVGGLPGQAGCKLKEVTRYIGRRNGDTLVLSGGKQAIFVDVEGCTLIDSQGRNVGRLDRTERISKSIDVRPPEGAIVIFDGKSTDQLSPGEFTDEGNLKHGAVIGPMAQDFDLHVEFKLPLMPDQLDQKRGNSGIYVQSRYECQVLDSFATMPAINSSGAIYEFKPADLNAALPPTVWQTYDIRFTAPRWNANAEKIRNARISSWLNGIQVQNEVEIKSQTGLGAKEEPTLLPTKLQNHHDAVQFRNVWMIDRGLTPGIEFPIWTSKDSDSSDDFKNSPELADAADAVSPNESKALEEVFTFKDPQIAIGDKTETATPGVTSDSGDAAVK